MPNYSSKSQKRSQSQSKNGGRRKKRTLKNVRRRKSRKVMMGGGVNYRDVNDVKTLFKDKPKLQKDLFQALGYDNLNDIMKFYSNSSFNTDLIARAIRERNSTGYDALIELLRSATY